MYVDFIQSFSFNYWIKINFDSKFIMSSKIQNVVMHILFNFLPIFRIPKGYHQDYSFTKHYDTHYTYVYLVKSRSPFMCFHPSMPTWL
jgi:hypothetical protein